MTLKFKFRSFCLYIPRSRVTGNSHHACFCCYCCFKWGLSKWQGIQPGASWMLVKHSTNRSTSYITFYQIQFPHRLEPRRTLTCWCCYLHLSHFLPHRKQRDLVKLWEHVYFKKTLNRLSYKRTWKDIRKYYSSQKSLATCRPAPSRSVQSLKLEGNSIAGNPLGKIKLTLEWRELPRGQISPLKGRICISSFLTSPRTNVYNNGIVSHFRQSPGQVIPALPWLCRLRSYAFTKPGRGRTNRGSRPKLPRLPGRCSQSCGKEALASWLRRTAAREGLRTAGRNPRAVRRRKRLTRGTLRCSVAGFFSRVASAAGRRHVGKPGCVGHVGGRGGSSMRALPSCQSCSLWMHVFVYMEKLANPKRTQWYFCGRFVLLWTFFCHICRLPVGFDFHFCRFFFKEKNVQLSGLGEWEELGEGKPRNQNVLYENFNKKDKRVLL